MTTISPEGQNKRASRLVPEEGNIEGEGFLPRCRLLFEFEAARPRLIYHQTSHNTLSVLCYQQ